ncbi:hypothetical protein CHFL109739_18995 [Chryseobacterium flavum]|nr:hypothetical protein [Chryseobacterium flavum]
MEGEPVPGGSGPGGPQAIGTASSPIDVGKIVLNAPIRAVSNNNLATCSYCMTGQGKNLREQLNIPGPPKVQSIEEAQRILKPVLHNGSAQMMDSMIWDLAGILIARNIKPENQNAALGLAALAIIVSKGRATPAIAKAEAGIAKAEIVISNELH